MPVPRRYDLIRDAIEMVADDDSIGTRARRGAAAGKTELDRRVRAVAERERRNNEVRVYFVEPQGDRMAARMEKTAHPGIFRRGGRYEVIVVPDDLKVTVEQHEPRSALRRRLARARPAAQRGRAHPRRGAEVETRP